MVSDPQLTCPLPPCFRTKLDRESQDERVQPFPVGRLLQRSTQHMRSTTLLPQAVEGHSGACPPFLDRGSECNRDVELWHVAGGAGAKHIAFPASICDVTALSCRRFSPKPRVLLPQAAPPGSKWAQTAGWRRRGGVGKREGKGGTETELFPIRRQWQCVEAIFQGAE